MADQPKSPKIVLERILRDLRSGDETSRLAAIRELHDLNYTSEAIRAELEKLALHDENDAVRKEALAALDLPTSRHIRSLATKLSHFDRKVVLTEIEDWQDSALLDSAQADVLKRRYDFDIKPPPAGPVTAPIRETVPAPEPEPAVTAPQEAPQPVPTPTPTTPAEPRSLLQALLSETSIKIALYLGAFFVIAAAIILGTLVEAARLPILIVATLIFGGVALAIRKRLPQPSFALFIVFSFLLPITANVIEESLELTGPANAAYWVFVSAFMALIWGGSTWFYESRLFSIAAFLALASALYRVGDIFEAEPEFSAAMLGLAALGGLAGAWALKNWRDAKFSLPSFLAAQALQVIALGFTFIAAAIRVFDSPTPALWNLASVFTWGLAFGFYVFSNWLYPFILFPWLAAATLLPIPWFISAAFDLESPGVVILFFMWGLILAAGSEAIHSVEAYRKYGLPVLLASIPTFAAAVMAGFDHNTAGGFTASFAVFLVYGLLHLGRVRGWLWALALLNFVIAYFAFFNIGFIEEANVFFGYQLLGLSLIFLLPDLFLKNDFKADLAWRLPPRIYGAFFTVLNFIIFAASEERPYINTAIVFLVYAAFFAFYALRYRQPLIAYVPTLALVLSIIQALDHFSLDYAFEALTILSVLYYFGGLAVRKDESLRSWRTTLTASGLALGSIVSLIALFTLRDYSGWWVAITGLLFIVEMYTRRQGLLEAGSHLFLPAALFLILRDFQLDDVIYILFGSSLIWLTLDLILSRTLKEKRSLEWPVRIAGAAAALIASYLLLFENDSAKAMLCFTTYTAFFALYTFIQRKAIYGYIPAAYLALTIFFTLDYFIVDAWLPALTGLAVLYFVVGMAIRAEDDWSLMLRNSALGLGTIISIGALISLKETGGWYALIAGLLCAAELYLRRDGRFEIGLPAMFSIGAFLILRDFNITETGYQLLAHSLVWLLADLLARMTFVHPRALKWIVRGVGGVLTFINYIYLFLEADARVAATSFGTYTLLFLTISLLYRQSNLLYTFTATLPLFIGFLFREFDVTKWIHPVIAIAVIYYAVGYFLRRAGRYPGWDKSLLFSGLGLGLIVSAAAPALGGLDAAIPVAVAATLWAVEAFARKNAWLGFPTNALYLLAYFIILFELQVDEPQFFSMGAALLGLLQHYFLTRAGSKTGALITGMVSQLILLGTTYIQMLDTEELIYFVVLFFQSIAVLVYGIVIRSRSLTFMPIGFVVLGVVTVIYSALKGISTVVLIGCTGVILLMLGILAVVMRERITRIGERLSSWQA